MKSHSGRTAEAEVYERKRMGGKGAEGELRSTCTGAGGLRGDGQHSDSQPRKRAREGAGATPATTLCRDDPVIATEPKSGSERSTGGSCTQRYVWSP